MKTCLRYLATIFLFVTIVSSCNPIDKIITEKVAVNESGLYCYASSGDMVTGTLENKVMFGKKMIIRQIRIQEGRPLALFDYNLKRDQIGKCVLNDGTISGAYEGNDCENVFVCSMVDGALDGVCKIYNSIGFQVKEVVYSKGTVIKSYDFDDNGQKIVPVEDCLKLEDYRTGFFEYVDYSYNKILYCPIVIFKFKNVSDKPFDIDTELTFTFIEDGEIISTTTANVYYHYGYTPIPVNVSKQCHSMSDVGKIGLYGVNVANIQCEVKMNGKPFKTLKIANKVLNSNRI